MIEQFMIVVNLINFWYLSKFIGPIDNNIIQYNK